jgi:ABC-type multidrug transport system fused ATPase/permease subunit
MKAAAAAPAQAIDVNSNQHGMKLNAHKVRFNFPSLIMIWFLKLQKSFILFFVALLTALATLSSIMSTAPSLILTTSLEAKLLLTPSSTQQSVINDNIASYLSSKSVVKIFCALKHQLIWQWLSTHNLFMKQHTLSLVDQVNACSPGWFS